MSITTRGPRCSGCNATEQECAYRYPCCPVGRCSHFTTLDADGNEKPHGNTKQAAA